MTSSNSVRLIFFEQSIGCESCAPTRRALRQVAASVEDVELEVLNLVLDKERAVQYGVDRVPAVIVAGPAGDRIRYYGPPLGNELPTLIEAIRLSATGETALSEQTRQRLQALREPIQLQVFFTPQCGYCPRMIALANQLAVASPHVSSTAIDATEYPDLVRRYSVNGVPKTVINDAVEVMGAVPEDQLVDAMLNLP